MGVVREYPRAWEATITDAETGEKEVIKAGENADALAYELSDMETAIKGDPSVLHFDYTIDVMDLMTKFRREWGVTYPEEENLNPTKNGAVIFSTAPFFTCSVLMVLILKVTHCTFDGKDSNDSNDNNNDSSRHILSLCLDQIR
ncbi:MAG: hypothetical protein VZR02_08220 [Lachnospiraceae bacterium]|nr:hypothetical protein [Lachnospiraceae bacterium]